MAGRKRDNERDRVCFVRSFILFCFVYRIFVVTNVEREDFITKRCTRRYLLEDAVISFIRANLLLLTSK